MNGKHESTKQTFEMIGCVHLQSHAALHSGCPQGSPTVPSPALLPPPHSSPIISSHHHFLLPSHLVSSLARPPHTLPFPSLPFASPLSPQPTAHVQVALQHLRLISFAPPAGCLARSIHTGAQAAQVWMVALQRNVQRISGKSLRTTEVCLFCLHLSPLSSRSYSWAFHVSRDVGLAELQGVTSQSPNLGQ